MAVHRHYDPTNDLVLKIANRLDASGKEELAMLNPEIKEAMDASDLYLMDDKKYWEYLQRESAILDYNNDFVDAIEDAKKKAIVEGKAQGLEEGKAQGLEEGKAQGLEEGKAQGLEEGKAQGLEEGKAQMEAAMTRMFVCNLLQNGNMEPEEIAKLANTTVENVARIAKESHLGD